ncbi:MAG: hypothetical protein K0Q81_789 [Paenibacillus sp.]|nr:hypothetical protein [Paenibacillus sp.]
MHFQLEETTIRNIRAAFDLGEITSHGLTFLYLERIARIDKSGPALNAVRLTLESRRGCKIKAHNRDK